MPDNLQVLVDVKSVQIDKTLPVEERLIDFVSKIGNPYHFLCGDTPVEIQFAEPGAGKLEDMITDYLITKKIL